ncbi:unnamed protein product [Amoebophrya sp. A25]|nr:unnamed protein product [Amoebophrya sp. A25]|eukprot:GSA25T00008617001.1
MYFNGAISSLLQEQSGKFNMKSSRAGKMTYFLLSLSLQQHSLTPGKPWAVQMFTLDYLKSLERPVMGRSVA